MKKSGDLGNALLLSHFPEHHKMSRPHLTTFALKKILLVLGSGLIIAVLTAACLVQAARRQMLDEKLARLETEERVERMRYEITRLQELGQYSAGQNIDLVKNLHDVVESGEGDQKMFLSLIVPEALRIQISHGIPASATIAMSIYESSYGRSELANNAHNYFGIKAFASVWDGPTIYTTTRDNGKKTKAYFRQYPDVEAAVLGYATFLKSSDRYADAFLQRDGDKFVEYVLKAGYCPDKDYHKNIQAIMERHHLKKLDLPGSSVADVRTDQLHTAPSSVAGAPAAAPLVHS